MAERPARHYDLIVIGGGITGAGLARDAAMRGMRTLLVERNDFGAGTSGTSMGMLHGGVRYMFSDPTITRLSCEESGIIQKIVPHICFRIPWMTLLYSERKIAAFEAAFEAYDRLAPLKNSEPHVLLTREEACRLEPGLDGPFVAALTMDEPGVNVFRLVILNVISAAQHGAEVRNHCEVVEILRRGRRATGVRARDHLNDVELTFEADWVINAAGPWTPWVAAMAGVPFRLKPTKGVHVIFDRRLTNVAINFREGIEILPHESVSLGGLTDTFFFDSPDQALPTRQEVDYLLSNMVGSMPSIREARVVRAMAGVRPLIDQPGDNERRLSRRYQVIDHGERDGLERLITLAGGKMVLYRIMAEEAVDLLCRREGSRAACRTKEEILPGGNTTEVDVLGIAQELQLPLQNVLRAWTRQGGDTCKALVAPKSLPSQASTTCLCEPVMETELRHAIRLEWARTLDDLRRRTRLGMGPCQGMGCTLQAAAILTSELELSSAQAGQAAMVFLQERWKGRRPTLAGKQLAQEQLTRAIYIGMAGYGDRKVDIHLRPRPVMPPLVPAGRRHVLVIGGGMAGAAAALSAAEAGSVVTLVRKGYGATALSSGVIDLDWPTPWRPEDQLVAEAVSWLQDKLADVDLDYLRPSSGPASLLTMAGTIKRGHVLPATFLSGDVNPSNWQGQTLRLMVIGVPGLREVSAEFLASSWQEAIGALGVSALQTMSREVAVTGGKRSGDLSPFQLAEALDADETARVWGKSIRQAHADFRAAIVALPPIVGMRRPCKTLAIIQEEVGLPCFEVVPLHSSVPGFRLQRALEKLLWRQGIRLVHGTVCHWEAAGRRIKRVGWKEGITIRQDDVDIIILASGHFIGGGLVDGGTLDREVHEAIFGLTVHDQGGEPAEFHQEMLAEQFLDLQPLFLAGLKVDGALRPVSADGTAAYENLLAVGSVLHGGWWGAEGGSLGRALVTGYLAGRMMPNEGIA